MSDEQLNRRLADLERIVNQLLAPKSKPRLIINGASKVLKSPSGGIAALSGTTISSATCTQWDRSGSTISAGSDTETVYNLSTTAVASNAMIVAVETNMGWVAVWEDC